MKKRLIIILPIILVFIITICYFIFRFKLKVSLKDNRDVIFGEEVNLKDFILDSNANFLDTYISLYKIGNNDVTIPYIDKYNRKKEYNFNINVIDVDEPIILANGVVTSYINEDINLLKNVICVDYISSNVTCEVEGDYDTNKIGKYNLKYVSKDESGNSTSKDLILNIIERPKYTNRNINTKPNYIPFKEIYDKYKTDNTLIGIDVSRFQGNIDFEKVKNAGVEFVIIRLGWYVDGELGLDYNFKKYIEDAYNAGLKIGLYFYSEASSMQEVDSIVDFIINNIKYKIDLPIAYDWEDFNDYNSYKLSLYEFNNLAYHFMDKLKEKGMDSILYASKYYLEHMWFIKDYPLWLAQYYKEVTYDGDYKIWQLTDNAKVDGINTGVDVDILYLDK